MQARIPAAMSRRYFTANCSQSGMSKCFRAYAPQNVIGDFTENNQFFAGDEPRYEDGKLQIVRGEKPLPFSRMELRDGKHYFSILESDGQWAHLSCRLYDWLKMAAGVRDEISEWPGSRVPIQYSAIEKQWLNYWKVIDHPEARARICICGKNSTRRRATRPFAPSVTPANCATRRPALRARQSGIPRERYQLRNVPWSVCPARILDEHR